MELHFYYIFLLIFSLQVCLGEVRRPDAAAIVLPFAPGSPQSSKCANKQTAADPARQSNVLQFRLPFMDMNILNARNMHMIQELATQKLFILHGKELYELFVSREEKRLSLIGALAGGVRQEEPLSAKVVFWRNYFLVVVALEEYLEIYQLPAILLAQNAEAAKMNQVNINTITNFEPVQQLTFNGRFRKLFLLNVADERVMLLTAVNYTKSQSKIRTYEWSNTFFDMVEDLTISAVNVLEVIGTAPKFLLSGRFIKEQHRTIVVVQEIDPNDLHLRNRQTLTIPSRTIHTFTFRGRNYLIGCAAQQQKCNLFRMKPEDAQFSVYRQFSSNELTFDRFVAGGHFLVGTQQRAVNTYPTSRLDCYASFTADERDVDEIITHVSQQEESFVLLNYRRPLNTLLRIVEVETADGQRLGALPSTVSNDTVLEDLSDLQQHRHLFEGTVQRLRSLLLHRKSAMDVFRKAAAILRPKLQRLNAPNAVHLHAGNIGIVRISDKTLQSPLQLLRRLEALRVPQRSMRFTRQAFPSTGFLLDMPRVAKVQRLHVGNLLYNGTILPGFYLDNTSTTRLPMLSIRSSIRTKVLSTPQLLTRNSFLQSRLDANDSNSFPIRVRDLSVERINNVSVSEFLNSTFLHNRDGKLIGRLILQGETKVDALTTTLLNDWDVAKLFNLKEPQVVSSKLLINSITAKDVQAELVNGLRFEEDVAFSGREDIIEAPVIIKHMSIAGDLLVDYKPKLERNIDDNDTQFQQFYTGKVIIKGSLTVDNLMRDNSMSTAVFVNGLPFSETMLREIYLLHNTSQSIYADVQFGNAKVTTPKFNTNLLNGHPTTQHLLTTGQPSLEIPLLLIFMQATVDGDIICETHNSKLLELSTDAVRHGDVVNITSAKVFQAALTVDQLTTRKLNNLTADDLILKSQMLHELRFAGNKSFDKLVVTRNAFIKDSLNSTFLNDENVKTSTQRDYYFKQMSLPYHLQSTNIVVQKINGVAFNRIFDRLSVKNEQLVLRKDMLVKGNVRFVENLQVDKINEIEWSEYVNNLVRLNENARINGTTHFLRGLTVKNALETPLINTVRMEDVFSNALLKSKPQQITGQYTFGNMRLTNLDVDIINDIPTNTFIDTRSKELILHGDLIVPKLTVHSDISGNFMNTFQFAALNEQLQQLAQRRWRNLVVHGNANWNASAVSDIGTKQYDLLRYLYEHAVRRNGDQLITGTVYMTQPIISRMRTRAIFPSGVDLSYIARDCLLKNTTVPQIITGNKLFHNPLRMQRAMVAAPLKITTLNGIDVQRFHASLYRLSSGYPISGPLHFKIPPIIGQLMVQGLVNGMPIAHIYTTQQALMPPVRMHSLVVDEDLQIGAINGLSLDYLLNKRIKLNGEPQEVLGYWIFENLVLNNETLLQSINGVPIDNLIFKKSEHLQLVGGRKVIDGSLLFNGPAHVTNLNGQRLVDLYKESLFTTGNYHFNNLTIGEGIFAKGLVLVGRMPMSARSRTMSTAVTAKIEKGLEDQAHGKGGNMLEEKEVAGALQENQLFEDLVNQVESDDGGFREQLTDAVNQLSNLLSPANSSAADDRKKHLLYLDFDFDTEVLKQYANESVADTFLYDLQHVSLCEHRLLQVQSAQNNRRLFITNVTTSLLSAQAGTISVKAQNYCANRDKKVKSKITVNGQKLTKVFGMRKYIERIAMFADIANYTYLLLHATDAARNRSEVRVLRLNDELAEITDWQTITFGIGNAMQLFTFDNFTVLLSAALVNNRHAVSIYHFIPEAGHFKLAQVIDGPYDVVELVAVQPHRYHLLLSCHSCEHVNVYDLTAAPTQPYKLFQIIKLPIRIDKLHTFAMSDGEIFLLTLGEQQQDFYHLYKYTAIQGWLNSTFGYFRDIKLAVPLWAKLVESNDSDLLLLLCGGGEMDRCSLVRPFTQL